MDPAVKLPRWFTDTAEKPEAESYQRIDYELQASSSGSISSLMTGLSMLQAHGYYWKSKDVALFVLTSLTGIKPPPIFDNEWSD